MEMHELQQAWQALDDRLGRQALELRALRRARGLDAARARLQRISLGQFAQLAIGLLLVVWAGGYWSERLGQPALLASGIALHLYGLALLVAAAMQLVRLLAIDYRAPVVQVQRRLLGLRRLRIHCERVLLLVGAAIWVPVLLIGFAALGIDLWASRPGVVLANLAFGLVLALLAAWAMRRFRTAFERDAVGGSLAAAEAELADLQAGETA
jgi:hypothetical protein